MIIETTPQVGIPEAWAAKSTMVGWVVVITGDVGASVVVVVVVVVGDVVAGIVISVKITNHDTKIVYCIERSCFNRYVLISEILVRFRGLKFKKKVKKILNLHFLTSNKVIEKITDLRSSLIIIRYVSRIFKNNIKYATNKKIFIAKMSNC